MGLKKVFLNLTKKTVQQSNWNSSNFLKAPGDLDRWMLASLMDGPWLGDHVVVTMEDAATPEYEQSVRDDWPDENWTFERLRNGAWLDEGEGPFTERQTEPSTELVE